MTPDITPRELSAAYRAAGLRRIGCGLAKALQTPALYTALRCTALAMKKKDQQQHGKPAPILRAQT